MAKPIIVDPSQAWDGDDGPWSSFFIRVGNPAQNLRVLASTTVPETWVVLESGCTPQDPSGCNLARGSLFSPNTSTTWQDQGLFALGVETNLPYTGNFDNGDYGFDTLGLGLQGNGVTVNHTIVAGVATKDFFLGNLGLTPRPINFTQFDDPKPSLLTTLRNSNQIPSLSYGYSAGARYRLKQVDATLTLGGYDQSRFMPNNVLFNFASDISRDIVVGLQSIQFTDQKSTKNLLPGNGILTFIDSTVPHIWLPLDACLAFEKAFGITYDNATDLYLVSDSQHSALKSQNASVSFILGNEVQGGQTVNITLPYASFDLQLTQYYPGINDTTQYFPLRRAANDTQYTLGRTFLQESYLTVDYERLNFNVSQALFQNNVPQKIITIPSVNSTNSTGPGNNITKVPQTPPPSRKLSAGATAGIIIAALALCALAIGAFTFWYLRRRKSRKSTADDTNSDKAEMDDSGRPTVGELYDENGVPKKPGLEMEGSNPDLVLDEKPGRPRLEMQGSSGGAEMEGSRPHLEMQGSEGGVEMEGSHGAAEMSAHPNEVYELPANYGHRELSTDREPSQRRRAQSRRGRESNRWSFVRGR